MMMIAWIVKNTSKASVENLPIVEYLLENRKVALLIMMDELDGIYRQGKRNKWWGYWIHSL